MSCTMSQSNCEWKECKLGEVCLKITDGAHNSPPTVNTGYPMASVKDMEYNKINIDSCRRISSENYNLLVKNGCKPLINDVLIAKDGSYLKHVFDVTEDVDIVLLSSIAIVRPNTKIIMPKFLKYIFKNPSFRDIVEGNFVTGAVIPRIVLKDFKNIDILLPPLPEQKAIASVLSSLDDKIDLLHRQNKTLEAMAETLFRQWFVSSPEQACPESVERVEGEKADEGWEEKPLSFFGEIICGKTPSKKTPYYFGGDVPFIKIPDMHGNVFIFNTSDSLTEKGKASQMKKTLPPKSICVSCIATVGLVSLNVIESQTNQQINSIVPMKDYYRYYIFLTMKASCDILQSMASGGTATLNLNTGDFSKIPIPYPGETALNDFHINVENLFEKIFVNSRQIRTLEKLRDNLLPKLMSGEVRVLNHD